jgi:hypothetical protein
MQRGWLRSIEPGSFGGDESVPKSRRDIIENAALEDGRLRIASAKAKASQPFGLVPPVIQHASSASPAHAASSP